MESLASLADALDLDAFAGEQLRLAETKLLNLERSIATLRRATEHLTAAERSFRKRAQDQSTKPLQTSQKGGNAHAGQIKELADVYNAAGLEFDQLSLTAAALTKSGKLNDTSVLSKDGEQAMSDFVEHVMDSLDALAHAIAKWEGHSLSSLLSSGSETHKRSPIEVLMRLVHDAAGPEALRDLVVQICSHAMGQWKKGVSSAREQELDSLLISLLELVDSLASECMPALSATSSDESPSARSPLRIDRATELLLIDFLNELRSRQRDRPGFDGLPDLPDDESWTSTLTGLVSLPFVASTTFLASSFGAQQDNVKQKSTSSTHSRKPSEEGLENVLSRHAARMLDSLASRWPLFPAPVPLAHAIIAKLLFQVFPAVSQPAVHRKLVALLVLRFYGFEWLGRQLHWPDLEGCYVSPHDLAFGLLPLHQTMYHALVDVAGYSEGQIDPGSDDLRMAAGRVLQSFGASTTDPSTEVQELEQSRPGSGTILLTASDLFALYDVAGSLLLTRSRSHSIEHFRASIGPGRHNSISSKGSKTTDDGDEEESDDAEPPTPLRQSLSQRVAIALADLQSSANLQGSAAVQTASLIFVDRESLTTSTQPFLPHESSLSRHGSQHVRLSISSASAKSSLRRLSVADLHLIREALTHICYSAVANQPGLSLSEVLERTACHAIDSPSVSALLQRARSLLSALSPGNELDRQVLDLFAQPLKHTAVQRNEQRIAIDIHTARASRLWKEVVNTAVEQLRRFSALRVHWWYRLALRRLPIVEDLRKPMVAASPILPSGDKVTAREGLDFICDDRGVLTQQLGAMRKTLDRLTEPAFLGESIFWQRETAMLGSAHHAGLGGLLGGHNPFSNSRPATPRITTSMSDTGLRDFGVSPAALLLPTVSPHEIGFRAFNDLLRIKLTSLLLSDLQADGVGPLSLPLLHVERLLGPSVLARPSAADDSTFLLRFAVAHPSLEVKLRSILELVTVQSLHTSSKPRPLSKRASLRALSSPISPARSTTSTDSVDDLIASTETLIASHHSRPPRLLLALQLLAELTPETMLNMSQSGKAFWDVSVSALSWKRDALAAKVKDAMELLDNSDQFERERAQGVILIAALEGNEEALEALPSLGLA